MIHWSIWMIGVLGFLSVRAVICLRFYNKKTTLNARNISKKSKTTFIVFGSGGHTAEMLQLIKKLDVSKYSPTYFVLANTDKTTRNKIEVSGCTVLKNVKDWLVIQRSREVNQPLLTTVFTTLKATFESIALVLLYMPDAIVCNGPGTCVPLCWALFLLKVLYIKPNASIVFVESFCRVNTLSVSGKLLYCISDVFVVQWEKLVDKYPCAQYVGVIC